MAGKGEADVAECKRVCDARAGVCLKGTREKLMDSFLGGVGC